MNDFMFQNTTKIYFGKNQLQHLGEEAAKFGKTGKLEGFTTLTPADVVNIYKMSL